MHNIQTMTGGQYDGCSAVCIRCMLYIKRIIHVCGKDGAKERYPQAAG